MEIRDRARPAPTAKPASTSSAEKTGTGASSQVKAPSTQAVKDRMAPAASSPKLELNPAAPAATRPAVPVPQVDLRRGDQGENVKQLQDALVAGGHMTREEVNTGYGTFGPRTEAAVKAVQTKNGLPATGAFDASARAALSSELGVPPPPSTRVGEVVVPQENLGRGSFGESVQNLQDGMVKLGYMTQDQVNTGPGMYGPKTEAAVRALQARNGLEPTGSFDAATRAAMEGEARQLQDPKEMVKATYEAMLNRPPTAAELDAASGRATALRDAGGSLRDMRQDLGGQIRQTDEYRALHPLGSGTVSTVDDANQYFVTQWGGTDYNSAQGAPYGYNDCGPTSGVMALSAIGLMERPAPDQAGAAIDGVRDAALGYDSKESTRMGFGTLAKGVEAYGAQTQMLSGGVPSIDAALERGNPVIIGGNPWEAWGKDARAEGNYLNSRDPGGHFVTLLGKTQDGKYIVGDPLVKGGTLAVSEDQLKTFLGSGFGAMEVSRP